MADDPSDAPSRDLRIATFSAPLSRDGPGLLLRDILKGDDEEILATVAIISHIDPDVLLLTNFDHDAGGAALTAFADLFETPYPHRFAGRPNAGVQVGLDMDGDGYRGDARDALGYGRFMGDGGMALLSRFPIDHANIVDLTPTLWADVPGAQMPVVDGAPFPSAAAASVWPVSSKSHWIVPVDVAGVDISVMAFAATAPVFDGPEDANGLRNRDELRLFEAVLDGAFGPPPPRPVLLGLVNADPFDGEGLRGGIANVLTRPDLQNPTPQSQGGKLAQDPQHSGDPSLDTADWPSDGPGNLRVSYILPSADLTVTGAGVFWPAPGALHSALLGEDGQAAGPHRIVWVDLLLPGP